MTEQEGRSGKDRRVTALRDALDVYVSGRSGIRFEALMRFAGPLFDLYEVEWRFDTHDATARDEEELTTMVAVLDTARLLWSFFALDDEENLAALPDLEDALLGRGAGDEERSNLLVLLSLLEAHYRMFSADDRAEATNTPGFALPEFESLLSDYGGRKRSLPPHRPATYGPDELELPEALAVFAEPLVRGPELQNDPDLVEQRMERAQAYWDLAIAREEEYESRLRHIQERFADTDRERDIIRQEAEWMVTRFKKLFSERSRKG